MMKYMFLLSSLFVSLSVQTPTPETIRTTHSYRDKYFLSKKEGQSCPDIAAERSQGKYIEFCSIPAPHPTTLMTISFWGWDQGVGVLQGLLQVYGVYNMSQETKLFDIQVPRKRAGRSNVTWFHKDFTLLDSTSQNITGLKLVYYVGKGEGITLDLRDIWIRPTSVDSGKRPPRLCNRVLYSISFCFLISSVLIACFFLIKVCNKDYHLHMDLLLGLSSLLLIPVLSILLNYLSRYPNPRCKNDNQFEAIIAMSCIIPIFIFMLSISIRSNIRIAPLPNHSIEEKNQNNNQNINSQLTQSKVIEIAKKNTLENKNRNKNLKSSSSVHPAPIYNTSETTNECSICMTSYSIDRPGIVTKCGHVWCSECVVGICQMQPSNQNGTCPICRSSVEVNKLILFEEDSVKDIE